MKKTGEMKGNLNQESSLSAHPCSCAQLDQLNCEWYEKNLKKKDRIHIWPYAEWWWRIVAIEVLVFEAQQVCASMYSTDGQSTYYLWNVSIRDGITCCYTQYTHQVMGLAHIGRHPRYQRCHVEDVVHEAFMGLAHIGRHPRYQRCHVEDVVHEAFDDVVEAPGDVRVQGRFELDVGLEQLQPGFKQRRRAQDGLSVLQQVIKAARYNNDVAGLWSTNVLSANSTMGYFFLLLIISTIA